MHISTRVFGTYLVRTRNKRVACQRVAATCPLGWPKRRERDENKDVSMFRRERRNLNRAEYRRRTLDVFCHVVKIIYATVRINPSPVSGRQTDGRPVALHRTGPRVLCASVFVLFSPIRITIT